MLKRFREALGAPKDGIISEQNMIARAVTTVVLVLVCLASMSLSAFAFFSVSVASESNVIRSASFVMEVSVTPAVTVTPSSDGLIHTAPLAAGTEYTFTLTRSASSTATTGFCKFSPQTSDETYYTTQLFEGNSFTFRVQVTNDAVLVLEANWGTSTYYATHSIDSHYLAESPSYLISFVTPAQSFGLGAPTPVQSAVGTAATETPMTIPTPVTMEPQDTEPQGIVPAVTEPIATQTPATETPEENQSVSAPVETQAAPEANQNAAAPEAETPDDTP